MSVAPTDQTHADQSATRHADDLLDRIDAAEAVKGLPRVQAATLRRLARATDARGYCRLKIDTIRKPSGASARGTRKALTALREAGYVAASWRVRLGASRFSCNRYVLDLTRLGLDQAPDPADVTRELMAREGRPLAHRRGLAEPPEEPQEAAAAAPASQPPEATNDQQDGDQEAEQLRAELARLRAERDQLAAALEDRERTGDDTPVLTGTLTGTQGVPVQGEEPSRVGEEGADAPPERARETGRDEPSDAPDETLGGVGEDGKTDDQTPQRPAEALATIVAPLPSRDRRLCAADSDLRDQVATALRAGWTGPQLRRAAITERCAWPEGGADWPPRLLGKRLGAVLREQDPPQPSAAADDPEPCATCGGAGVQLTTEAAEQCPDCAPPGRSPAPRGGAPEATEDTLGDWTPPPPDLAGWSL